jgi:sulfatase modifying factor 1
MNAFQGRFPVHDTGDDGVVGTVPVGAYPANG